MSVGVCANVGCFEVITNAKGLNFQAFCICNKYVSYTIPCAIIARATFRKPATFAPFT